MIIAKMRAEIVPADLTDLVEIRDVATRIWNEYYPAIISQAQIDYMLSMDYATEKLQKDMAEGVCIDKLLHDGVLIGFCAYGPLTDPDPSANSLKLHKIYVDPAAHGKGLGSWLLEKVETFARSSNYTKILLQVNKGNQRAIAAYQRNGYIVERAAVVDIGGGFVMDDYIMSKQLIADDQTIHGGEA